MLKNMISCTTYVLTWRTMRQVDPVVIRYLLELLVALAEHKLFGDQ